MPLILNTYSSDELLNLIAGIMQNADLDEHEGDWMERAETVMFIATRGSAGKDWGIRPLDLSRSRALDAAEREGEEEDD